MEDVKFTSADLTNGKLVLQGVQVGSFSIEDENGWLVLAPQRRTNSGVEIDLSSFDIEGEWMIRHLKGHDGLNTTGGIDSYEALLHAIVFG